MDLTGQTLGNYRIVCELGVGGMGTVYQGYDLSLQRDVAIKLIHPHLARKSSFRERFIQEARLMAHLDHPGIVKVYHLGVEKDLLYIPMEFIKGGNLRQLLDELIRKDKWIPMDEALQLVRQLCQTVEYAHKHGVLHRDIKPANLMLKPEPTGSLPFRVILTDLGLAKLLEGLGMTQEGTTVGTPAYMSPEQAVGQPTDPRSDVYSLGILLYELLVGRLPFPIRTASEAVSYHTRVAPPAPRSIKPELPESLERVILKALEKEPGKRYPSAAALGTVLEGGLASATEIAEPAGDPDGSLIKEYEKSVVAPPKPAARGPMTMLDEGSVAPRGESVFEGQPVAPAPGTRIQILHKDSTARVVTLSTGKVTIGRESDNTIILRDPKASRHHAQILWDGMEYRVMDLNSRNGTYVENAKLLPGVSETWRPGQMLRIGDTWLRLIPAAERVPSGIAGRSMSDSSKSAQASVSTKPIGVQVNPQNLTVEAGGSVSASMTLINQSPNVQHFLFSLTGVPPTWVANLPSSVQLMPGEKKEESFTLQVPRSPQSRAGPYVVTMRVSSLNDSTQFEDVKLTLKVSPYSQFNAEVYPPRLRVGQVARFTVNNRGNQQETYKVKLNDLSAELAFRPPEFNVTVPEGGSATQEFRAEVLQPKWLGGETTHSYKAQVSPAEGEPQTLQAEAISRAYIPTWVPPTIVPLCLLLAVGIIWLLSQIPGAPLPGSPTSTPTMTITQILSDTPTLTLTATLTATFTPTFTPTSTATSTFTSTPTSSHTITPTSTATNTPTPSPTPTNILLLPFDFYTRARDANWSSGAGALPFGGPGNDSRGFVRYQDGVSLEDGTNPSKVLEMHPQWIDDGVISGLYPAYTVGAGAHFRARIGFIARADGVCGDRRVKFQLNYQEAGIVQPLGEWVEACEGFLSTLDINLSGLAGRNVQFILVVLANGSSAQDWAVWVNPRIEY